MWTQGFVMALMGEGSAHKFTRANLCLSAVICCSLSKTSVIPAQAGIQTSGSERSPIQRVVQVGPFGIEALDQLQFPPALPCLDPLLARNGLVDV